jgi:hypothetical protein
LDAEVLTAGYLSLACAVLWRACLDAQHDGERAAAARRWLATDPFAAEIVEAVDAGIDMRILADWLADLEPVRQPALAI